MAKRYPPQNAKEDGLCEWVQPVRSGYRMACCDCSMVHELDFRIRAGRVQFRARRNNRSTAQLRRNRGGVVRVEVGEIY
jgi:hypothetical protein